MSAPFSPPVLRLFVACDLPGEAATALAAWQEQVVAPRRELRLNRSLHLTLCFLGQTPETAVERLAGALGEVPWSPIVAAAGPLLFLPERGKKRVVALPLVDAAGEEGGAEALRALQAATSAALAATGFYAPERRPYLPHLTVARYRRPGPPFSLQNVTLPRLCLSRLVLYTSVLARGGAVHTPLAAFEARQERSPAP